MKSLKKKGVIFLLCLLTAATAIGCADKGVKDKPADTVAVADKTSVLTYGAKADGTTDDSDAFATKETNQLNITSGRYYIGKSITVSASVRIDDGALIFVGEDVTVTFDGYVDAGLYQILSCEGTVILNRNSISYPEWFGAKADGYTDSTSAIQLAINCFPQGIGKVQFDAGTYLVSKTIKISALQSHLTLEGTARQTREISTQITMANNSKTVLYLLGESGGGTYDGGLEDVTIKNMEFSRRGMGVEFSDTILIENTIYTTFNNVGFSKSQNGLRCVNANGVRIESCHGTTGGDIAGKEVRGIYIDGSTRGSTGILITDYIYYGYGSVNSISYAYKDYNAPGANGTTTGDRRITNVECSGLVDYGLAFISESCGWAGDVSISVISMDGVRTAGLYFMANGLRTFQHANINNVYLRLDNEKAEALYCKNYANLSVTGMMVDNAVEGAKNTGIHLKGTSGSVLSNIQFCGNPFKKLLSLESCESCVITSCTSIFSGAVEVKNNTNTIVTSNVMSKATLDPTGSKECIIENKIFAK